MISTVAIVWNTMALLGSCSLLLLLSTYYFVKSLPQRKNPILVNLILTSYLASLPPLLLLFTGQQERIQIQWICTLQAVCMNSVVPMFSFALVALVFQTWSEIRAFTRDTTCILARFAYLKWMLVFAPYLIFLGWFMASLTNMLLPSANVGLRTFVFCTNEPLHSNDNMGDKLGYFMVACMVVSILLEVWIAISVYTRIRRCRVSPDLAYASSVFYSHVHLCVRLFAFSIMQLSPILLMALHHGGWHINGVRVRNVTQIMGSMFTLCTFIVFGTQRTVLQAWKILPPEVQVEKSNLG